MSLPCSREASLQTKATYQVNNTRWISRVTTRVGHHKEKVG